MKMSLVVRSLVLTLISVVAIASSSQVSANPEDSGSSHQFDFGSTSFLLELEKLFVAAFATQPDVTIETDVYAGTAQLFIVRDAEGSLTAISYTGNDGVSTSFSLDQLRSGFQVLKNHEGRDAVLLKVDPTFSAKSGGYAILRVLRNGMNGTFRNFRVYVKAIGGSVEISSDPDAKDAESDGNPFRGPFNYVFLQKNTVFGFTVGIDKILPKLR